MAVYHIALHNSVEREEGTRRKLAQAISKPNWQKTAWIVIRCHLESPPNFDPKEKEEEKGGRSPFWL